MTSSQNKKQNILITGAAGWLGINLINALINGIDLYEETFNLSKEINIKALVLPHELDNLKNRFGNNIQYEQGNILNIEDCRRFLQGSEGSTLFHLAGLIHPSFISELYKVNYQGTINITNASIENKLKKIIVMSSNSPIGCNKNKNEPFNEESVYNPYLNYGKSKMLMEKYINSIFNKGLIETTLVRGTWFYGPFQPDRQTLFFKMIKNGKVPIVGDGMNLRSMTNVENLSYALILIWKNNITNGKTYWISDEKPYSYIELINSIRHTLENEFKITCINKNIYIPNIFSDFAYIADIILQKINLYNSKIHVLSELNKNIFCTIEQAKNDFNYNPKIDLKNGLVRNIQQLINENITI